MEKARYEKKISDQSKEITKLKQQLSEIESGAKELQILIDSILAATALKYGKCEKEGDEVLGYRLEIPIEDVKTVLKNFDVKSDKKEESYVYGIIKK